MEWREMSRDEFDALPDAKKPPAPSAWDPIMAALESGRPVAIPVSDDADRKKKSLSVGRRAAIRGFTVAIRAGDGLIAVSRSGDRERLRTGRRPKSQESAGVGATGPEASGPQAEDGAAPRSTKGRRGDRA